MIPKHENHAGEFDEMNSKKWIYKYISVTIIWNTVYFTLLEQISAGGISKLTPNFDSLC